MLAQNILPDKKRTIAALLSFYALSPALVITVVLSALVVLIGAWALLISALSEICADVALAWAESSAVERLIMLVLAWALLAWILRVYRSFHHARV